MRRMDPSNFVILLDEGIYSCIFTLFPTGYYKAEVHLTVLVPPVTCVIDNVPVVGDEEVCLANCTAAGSRPPSRVQWLTDKLTEQMRTMTTSTLHPNGTTTTVNSLWGVPTREINHRLVQCVITSPALPKEKTLPFIIQVSSVCINTTAHQSLLTITLTLILLTHC
ncbi:hypothetical protein INR49_021943 [Caranx melampygus]|nr:hypothetical protein INR49_021943 [Caranx melampygus]